MVGARGFEPPTSSSRTMRATKLRHAPTENARCTGPADDSAGGVEPPSGGWRSAAEAARRLGPPARQSRRRQRGMITGWTPRRTRQMNTIGRQASWASGSSGGSVVSTGSSSPAKHPWRRRARTSVVTGSDGPGSSGVVRRRGGAMEGRRLVGRWPRGAPVDGPSPRSLAGRIRADTTTRRRAVHDCDGRRDRGRCRRAPRPSPTTRRARLRARRCREPARRHGSG